MNVLQLSFNGQMLKRGFWLYVWRIRHKKSMSEYWYIGRTGDSSSANASSPLARLSQHFNFKENAKGNSLIKNIIQAGINPEDCQFKLVSIGPLFPEKESYAEHVPCRDIVGKLEAEIAHTFKTKGLIVLGSHPKRGIYDHKLFNEVISKFSEILKSNPLL